MKNLRTFEEFVNESLNEISAKSNGGPSGYKWKPQPKSPLENLIAKLVTKQNVYEPKDLRYYRENAIGEFKYAGFKEDEKITLKTIVKDPRFEKLDDEWQLKIHVLVGNGGKSPYQEFIRLFVQGVSNFGIDKGDTIEEAKSLYVQCKKDLADDNYPSSYNGIPRDIRRKLYAIIDKPWMLKEILPNEDFEFIKGYTKKAYEKAANRLDDKFTKSYIEYMVDRYVSNKDYKDEYTKKHFFSALNKMTDLLAYIEDLIMKDEIYYKDFESMEISDKQVRSSHSGVSNSSFSTYYHYDFDITFKGKKFNYKDLIASSDYYSGGWN